MARGRKAAGSESSEVEWWTLWPQLYERELAAFERKGVAPQILLQSKGILIIRASWPVTDANTIDLLIGFSPLHPFFRPSVSAPNETFERHQDPIGKGLCLLAQEEGYWDSHQLVADFIDERLRQLLAATTARAEARMDDAAQLEENVADPLMPYYASGSEDDSVVLFDGEMDAPGVMHGVLELTIWGRPTHQNPNAFSAVLNKVENSAGRSIAQSFSLPRLPTGGRSVKGRWVKMRPPPTWNAEELLAAVQEELDRQAVLQNHSVQRITANAQQAFAVTGVVFSEEVQYAEKKEGVGWLFLVSRREATGAVSTSLVLGQRASWRDIFARLPTAHALKDKKVLLVGCGAIGSFVGLELARAGVGQITLFDKDHLEPGNSLRWPLGRSYWGRGKASALSEWITDNYPWTKATFVETGLGAAGTKAEAIEAELQNEHGPLTHLQKMIRESDLVIDTSASTEVQDALAHFCREANKPYVVGYGTMGAAGGVVAKFLAGVGGCWGCLRLHWHGNTMPRPRVDEGGVVAPVGCNSPTFTGGGFDLQEVSLEIVRSAIGMLSGEVYQAGDWQVGILNLRDPEGRRILPSWEACACEPHPDCCGVTQ